MTPEERLLLEGLFDRIRAAAGNPRDGEAEKLIADAVRAVPSAPYLLAQAVLVQEEALRLASAKIEELEGNLREQQTSAGTGAGSFLGGFGKSLFGADQRAQTAAAPPAPAAGPWGGRESPQPPGAGPWSRGGQEPQAAGAGSTFLKGALGAAAGVAGGMLLANSLGGLFSGQGASAASGTGKTAQDASSSTYDSSADWSRASYHVDDEEDDDDGNWDDGDTSDV